MKPSVHSMYFSATGTTKKVVSTVVAQMAEHWSTTVTQHSFTLPQARQEVTAFTAQDVVVFGVPVYAGRVPNVLVKFIQTIQGNGALAVPMVCFGNRNFDDALIELRDLLEQCGFQTIAAGAFVGEHSFSTVLAAGRPDQADLEEARQFGAKVAAYIDSQDSFSHPIPVEGEIPYRKHYVPRSRSGEPVNILKDRPKVYGDKCTNCGLCPKLCPMGSISVDDVAQYAGICIKCGACIKGCPTDARYYDSYNYLYHKEELELGFERRATISTFLPQD